MQYQGFARIVSNNNVTFSLICLGYIWGMEGKLISVSINGITMPCQVDKKIKLDVRSSNIIYNRHETLKYLKLKYGKTK